MAFSQLNQFILKYVATEVNELQIQGRERNMYGKVSQNNTHVR